MDALLTIATILVVLWTVIKIWFLVECALFLVGLVLAATISGK